MLSPVRPVIADLPTMVSRASGVNTASCRGTPEVEQSIFVALHVRKAPFLCQARLPWEFQSLGTRQLWDEQRRSSVPSAPVCCPAQHGQVHVCLTSTRGNKESSRVNATCG
jgi:hypothetical protein